MSTTKEIKSRIKSVHDTRKITNAMYLISSSKMSKAKNQLERSTPYFMLIRKEIRRIFDSVDGVSSIFVFDEKEEKLNPNGKYAYLVITADKGLAGAHNMNVIKKTLSLIEGVDNYQLFTIGDYGHNYFVSHGYNVAEDFFFSMLSPTLDMAREISENLLTRFEKEEITKLYIIYTHFENAFKGGEASAFELLPFEKGHFYNHNPLDDPDAEFEFIPSPGVVLDKVLRSYISGYIFASLSNSYCSEQCSRMTAMDAANKSADELLGALSMEYNHVRQGSITNEITEISSGARSLKRTAEKRKAKESLQ